MLIIREYTAGDLPTIIELWNEVVEDGLYFPQDQPLSLTEATDFFGSQTRTAVAELAGEIVGLYILHPNSVGRIGHIGNASYAVKRQLKGKKIGEKLVRDSLEQAQAAGFKIMQFNAVVANNYGALHLYEKIGFKKAGMIPKGFLLPDGSYEDIYIYYYLFEEMFGEKN